MPRPIEELSDQEIQNLIENHRNKKRTSEPRYLEALAEQARRIGHGLTFSASFKAIRAAAQEGRFLSYKQLADASGVEWTKVHYTIGSHLWTLVEYAHQHGWPMLSAVVVNQKNLETGDMEPETLKGFIGAAQALGFAVTDTQAFLKEQQQRVFKWAQSQVSGSQ
jgi:hypothetical protein